MKKMTFNVKNGNVKIDDYPIELSSFEIFTSSEFYKTHPQFTKIGKFYFSKNDIEWEGQNFIVEFRPAIFSFNPSLFLTSKDGDFYQLLKDWDKRASLKNLEEEERRLTEWVQNKFSRNNMGKINKPPYGTKWTYEWGEITVQSNERSFDCGIYIEWNLNL
ncbi:hypothetical protein RS425_004938 [Enterobacter kobei]|nr:hypothetical protein [Enterobacter kobei]